MHSSFLKTLVAFSLYKGKKAQLVNDKNNVKDQNTLDKTVNNIFLTAITYYEKNRFKNRHSSAAAAAASILAQTQVIKIDATKPLQNINLLGMAVSQITI